MVWILFVCLGRIVCVWFFCLLKIAVCVLSVDSHCFTEVKGNIYKLAGASLIINLTLKLSHTYNVCLCN